MNICEKCNKEFKNHIKIEGKYHRGGRSRKYCYDCAPVKHRRSNSCGTKVCTKCNKELSKDEFYKSRSMCKVCYNTYTAKRTLKFQRKNKEKAIEYLGGKCAECGYDGHPAAMHFHHIDPSTKDHVISFSRRMNIKFEKWTDELDKCILLCANCHAVKHAKF